MSRVGLEQPSLRDVFLKLHEGIEWHDSRCDMEIKITLTPFHELLVELSNGWKLMLGALNPHFNDYEKVDLQLKNGRTISFDHISNFKLSMVEIANAHICDTLSRNCQRIFSMDVLCKPCHEDLVVEIDLSRAEYNIRERYKTQRIYALHRIDVPHYTIHVLPNRFAMHVFEFIRDPRAATDKILEVCNAL